MTSSSGAEAKLSDEVDFKATPENDRSSIAENSSGSQFGEFSLDSQRWGSVRPISILFWPPLWVEEPEKPMFARAGKSDRFAKAYQSPAVLVFHFRRLGSPDGTRGLVNCFAVDFFPLGRAYEVPL